MSTTAPTHKESTMTGTTAGDFQRGEQFTWNGATYTVKDPRRLTPAGRKVSVVKVETNTVHTFNPTMEVEDAFDLTKALQQSSLQAVFATDGEHNTYRVSDPLGHLAAARVWTQLDDLRRAGRMPHVKFYEVRTVVLGPDRPVVGPEVRSHDRYDRAPLKLSLTRPVVKGRGYIKVEDAARAAWKLFAPTYRTWYDRRVDQPATGTQGSGGWFYYPNGQTVAQGLTDLARVARQKGLVVRGLNGRWYVVDREEL